MIDVTNLLPCIYVWSGVFIVYFAITAIRLAKFAKKHSGINETDQQKITPEVQEAKRQYFNKTMIAFCMAFIWAAGVVFICCIFTTAKGWYLVMLLLAMTLLPLISIKRKKK